jgi:hypothetical protein
MAKDTFSTTNMYRKPEGRKVGTYFKGKTESCNRAPHADEHAQGHVEDKLTHEQEPK